MKTLIRAMVVFSLCLFCLLSVDKLRAEQTGEIHGKVTDTEGQALPGVGITAKSPNLQGMRAVISDKNGNFRLPLLPVGEYSLTYEREGFEKLTTTGNRVYLGATLSVSVILKIAAVSEEVTVIAKNPLIDKTNVDNSYRLTEDDLSLLPTQARSIAEVVSYTPGVTGVRANTVDGTDTGSPSFRGEGDAGNNWLVDGLSLKGAIYNNLGVQLGLDVWEEVQIVSDGFSPELGQAMGGFVNIVTKSGGNSFHGELGGLMRSSRLRAQRQEQLSVATLPETSLGNFYGNIGGPLFKDKLWFFVSNNFHRSSDITQEQAIGWLTIPDGKRYINTDNFFGKATYTPQNNHTLSLSAALDSFLNQSGGIGLPEAYDKETYSDYVYRLNYRGILSQNTLLTLAAGHSKNKREVLPLNGDSGTPSYYWEDIGQTTNNAYAQWDEHELRTDLDFNLSQFMNLGSWGEHEIKAGIFYYKNATGFNTYYTGQDYDPWVGNGFDNGLQIGWVTPGIPGYLQEYGPSRGKNSSHGFGFHIGDTVKIGRFSLLLGLRAETQTVYNNLGEPIWSWGLGDFLTPRVSLAVDLLGDGKNVLKLGFGRFAQPHSLLILPFFNTEYGWPFINYSWIGVENPTEAQLQDPSNWEYGWEQSLAATPVAVDLELKPNTSTKFLLEFDRQLGTDWSLKIRGVLSRSKNLTESVNFYDPDLGTNLVYTNFDIKRRNYKALEIELNGKVAQRFMLNASYTWSRAKGTHPGNYFERLSWNSEWGFSSEISLFGYHPDVPEGDPNKEDLDMLYQGLGGPGSVGDEGWYGILPYSVDHVVKILGTYFAPFGVVASTAIEYLSGYHWEKKAFSEGLELYAIYSGGRGSLTTPAHVYADLMLEKEFVLKGLRLNVGMNVYNLLNSQKPVSYMNADTELFGQIWGRQLPRWMQIKIALRF